MDTQQMEKASSPASPPDGRDKASKDLSQTRVRRRNRMITSCLECRRRKLKCDKQQPCTNCTKFSRECMFLAPALDSVSQKKLNEIKEKMGTLERTLEEDVARQNSQGKKKHSRRESADLPGEGSESDEGPVPEDEKGLEATPLATVDAAYEDDGNDDVLDLGFRVGKFRMSERLGGLFRPKLAEEMVFALVRDNKRGTEQEAPLKDDPDTFLDPGPPFIPPGSGFIFGDVGTRRSIVDFLPTKAACDLLMRKYYNNVHFICRVVHWPTFQFQYDNFWTSILSGIEPPASLQAVVFAVCFSAIASMNNSEVDTVFHQTHRDVLVNFQTATETALAKAHFLRTTKFETLQALIIYLIPMCRGEISRAHSVLVGAAIRLGECFSLHRDPVDTFGHGPIDAHVRRLAWFQICYLDFRTAEAQGPRPGIKREDYDTKMPWNLDDADLPLAPIPNQQTFTIEEKEGVWTDATLSRIRFECCEMHRVVWHDRVRLDKHKVSITYCLSRIESFRNAMEKKYAWLDTSITIQHYARILLDLLLFRMHIMILHKFHNATSTRIPDRLRQIIITSGTKLLESAVKMDIDPQFESFKWYSTALQQWHTGFLLLVEVFVFPNRKEADRIWSIIDHVFEPDLSLSRVQKARSILGAVRDRAAAYRNVRKMKEPISMRNRLATNLPARGRIRGPDMIVPEDKPTERNEAPATQVIYSNADRRGSNPYQTQPYQSPNSINSILNPPAQNMHAAALDSNTVAHSSWNMDTPFTSFVSNPAHRRAISQIYSGKTELAPTGSPSQFNGVQHYGEPSPSDSSHYTEPWPPSVTTTQQATYRVQRMSTSHSVGSPSDQANSPTPLYGNSALGVLSGQYIPNSHLSGISNSVMYSAAPSIGQTASPEPITVKDSNNAAKSNLMSQNAAWGPTEVMPVNQDIPMLDIDWSEWDKLFPIEMNNGELDRPKSSQVAY